MAGSLYTEQAWMNQDGLGITENAESPTE